MYETSATAGTRVRHIRGRLGLDPCFGAEMSGQLPRFLGIGAQKGGTTSLQRLLEQHPGAYLPPAKELHYFSLHFEKGEAWYRQQFLPALPGQLCGEITPYYLFHPEVPERVHALIPDVRFIVLLRDPVERALSQYFHSVRLGLETLPLEEAFAAEAARLQGAELSLRAVNGRHSSHQEHSYLARSRYEQQLPRWTSRFQSAQILVMRSEDLFQDPAPAWQRLQMFLGLKLIPLPAHNRPANSGDGEARVVSRAVRVFLREKLRQTYLWAASHYEIYWPS